MIRIIPFFLLGILIFFFETPSKANQREPVRLSPSSDWHLDYAEDSCRLARGFGEGDQQVTLLMDRFQPGDSFRVTLVGRPIGRIQPLRNVTLRFGPTEDAQDVTFQQATVGDAPAVIFHGTMRIAALTPEERDAWRSRTESEFLDVVDHAPIDPAREAAVRYVQIDLPRRPSLILATGSMGPPLNALRQCIDELLTHWEIDVERHRTLSRRPRPEQSPTRWITAADYPADALSRGQQAIVHFRLTVNEQGRVTGCRIQRATYGESFQTAVCNAFMRRARFEPALDAEGNPIQSYFLCTVRFVMP